MLEKIRQKWVEWIFAIVLVIITTILTNSFTVRRDANTILKAEINQKVNKADVEAGQAQLRMEIKQGDDNVRGMLDQHSKETNERMVSMDRKLDILLSRTK